MNLLEQPELLRSLLDGLPEALVVADLQGVIRYWNDAAQVLFGHSREEALGASLDLIVPERFKAAHDAGFARAIASGQLRVGGRVLRTRANHKDGRKLYVDFSFALLKDASGQVVAVYATGRDVTEAQLKASSAR
jgi:PAS domain S-box-containing protein